MGANLAARFNPLQYTSTAPADIPKTFSSAFLAFLMSHVPLFAAWLSTLICKTQRIGNSLLQPEEIFRFSISKKGIYNGFSLLFGPSCQFSNPPEIDSNRSSVR